MKLKSIESYKSYKSRFRHKTKNFRSTSKKKFNQNKKEHSNNKKNCTFADSKKNHIKHNQNGKEKKGRIGANTVY